MRKREGSTELTVNAVAGSYVVVLGLNITNAMRKGLRGFAIQRTDHSDNETFWMKGTKVFESVEPRPAQGVQYSSLKHPFQSFQWSDYSAKPGHTYTYKVVAMYGEPGGLEQGQSVKVKVTTESIDAVDHTIHFNRGSAATQEYRGASRTCRRASSGNPPMTGCRGA